MRFTVIVYLAPKRRCQRRFYSSEFLVTEHTSLSHFMKIRQVVTSRFVVFVVTAQLSQNIPRYNQHNH